MLTIHDSRLTTHDSRLTAGQVATYLQDRADAGVDYFVVCLRRAAYEPDQVEWFGREVVPLVRAS